MVLEVPPGVLGILNDAHWRWVSDLGLEGPDKGKPAASTWCVPPGYTGTLPSEGYFVMKTRTFSHNVILRGFVQGSDLPDHREEPQEHQDRLAGGGIESDANEVAEQLLGYADRHGPRQAIGTFFKTS